MDVRQVSMDFIHQVADNRGVVKKVFKIGVIEIGTGYVRLYNHTSDRTIRVTPEKEAKWREWLSRQKGWTMTTPSVPSVV